MSSSYVELRVHGVSGTPPEDMLGSRYVVQVAGDESSSFFRPADAMGDAVDSGEHVLEAYHWGKFTSGSWRQGLWLALLPFGCVNAAQFMLPRPGPAPTPELFEHPEAASTPTVRAATRWHAVSGGMLRLAGLALTCMLVLSAAVAFMDLTAWQWSSLRPELTWEVVPGWPLAAAMVACAGVLLLLHSFGRQHTDHEPPAAPDDAKGAPDIPPTDLGRASFFRGDPDAPQLRRLHLAAGLTLIALLGFTAAGGAGDAGDAGDAGGAGGAGDAGDAGDAGGAGGWARWGYAVSAGWLGLLIVITVFLGDPERGSRGIAVGRLWTWRQTWHERVLPAATRPLVVVSGLLFATAGWACAIQPLADDGTALPGVDGVAFAVLLFCVIALAVLFLSCGVLAALTRTRGATAPPAPFARFAMGMTASLVTAIGVFLGVGYAAAFSYGWAYLLNRGGGPRADVPPLLQRVAYAWGLTVLLIVVLAVCAVIWFRCRHNEFEDRARAAFTFGDRPGCRLPPRWLPRVARAMFLARLKNTVQLVFWVFALFGIVLSAAAGAEYALSRGSTGICDTRELPGPLAVLSEPQKCDSENLLIRLGTLALLGLAAALVLLGRGALRSRSLRRGVNVVWDVLAFWPRAVHPFVPPPYSQLAVADLRDRIRWHLGTGDPANPDPAARVVVAAHSQGSLIALSALLWLRAEERERVGFLTFGSQLRVQFPRAFPAYVNVEVLRWMLAMYAGRWVNLYRDTDAIAGPVLSWGHSPDQLGTQPTSCRLDDEHGRRDDVIDPVTGRRICGPEWRLLDPTPSDPQLQTGAVARIRAHSDFPEDPDWPAAVAAVLPPLPPGPPQEAPALGPRVRPGVGRTFDHGLSPPFSGGRTER